MELLKALYGVIGAPHPLMSLIIAFIVGGVLFSGGWWLIGIQHQKSIEYERNIEATHSRPREENQSDVTQRKLPVAITIVGGSNAKIRDNVGIGEMDLIHAENVENLDADGNILINPSNKK